MRTVKVRIAVAVDRKGGWCASGWDTKSKPEQYERDALAFEQADGTAVCPGHGLRWDLRTGLLLTRHETPNAKVSGPNGPHGRTT